MTTITYGTIATRVNAKQRRHIKRKAEAIERKGLKRILDQFLAKDSKIDKIISYKKIDTKVTTLSLNKKYQKSKDILTVSAKQKIQRASRPLI